MKTKSELLEILYFYDFLTVEESIIKSIKISIKSREIEEKISEYKNLENLGNISEKTLNKELKKIGKKLEKHKELINVDEEYLKRIYEQYDSLYYKDKYHLLYSTNQLPGYLDEKNGKKYISPYHHNKKKLEYNLFDYCESGNLRMVKHLHKKGELLSSLNFFYLKTGINRNMYDIVKYILDNSGNEIKDISIIFFLLINGDNGEMMKLFLDYLDRSGNESEIKLCYIDHCINNRKYQSLITLIKYGLKGTRKQVLELIGYNTKIDLIRTEALKLLFNSLELSAFMGDILNKICTDMDFCAIRLFHISGYSHLFDKVLLIKKILYYSDEKILIFCLENIIGTIPIAYYIMQGTLRRAGVPANTEQIKSIINEYYEKYKKEKNIFYRLFSNYF